MIATFGGASGTAVGVVGYSGATGESLEPLVRAAEAAARAGPAADDARPLRSDGAASADWGEPPAETSIRVFSRIAPGLGEAFAQARREARSLFGYAQHAMRSTYLATSTGLRLRHDQPSGYIEINAKSADRSTSAWVGAATADFVDVDVDDLDTHLRQRMAWSRRRVDLPPGRYETLLPPAAVADLMVQLLHVGGGRRRPRRALRLQQARRHARRRAPDPRARDAPQRPVRGGPAMHAVRGGPRLRPRLLGVRQRKRAAADDLARQRRPRRARADPALGRADGIALHPAGQQPDPGRPARARSPAAMIEGTTRGLLLTCLWYLCEVNPRTLLLTGLTRDGVFLVERGEIVGAVNNFRLNESPVETAGAGRRGRPDGADARAPVARLLPAHGHADAPRRRLQHVDRQPGLLTARATRGGPSPRILR